MNKLPETKTDQGATIKFQLPKVTLIISLPVPAFCDTTVTCSPVSSTIPINSFPGLSFWCFEWSLGVMKISASAEPNRRKSRRRRNPQTDDSLWENEARQKNKYTSTRKNKKWNRQYEYQEREVREVTMKGILWIEETKYLKKVIDSEKTYTSLRKNKTWKVTARKWKSTSLAGNVRS